MQIAVIGSINTDLTIRVPHFSKPNETVVGTGNYSISQGGKGANQAAAAAAAGAKVQMIGKVGKDDFGDRAVESLIEAGVGCDHVVRATDYSTGLAAILVDEKGDNSITVAPGANGNVTAEDVDAAQSVIAASQIVMMQLEIPVDAVERAARIAHDGGATVILVPAPAPSTRLNFLDQVDYLIPNEIEAESLSGTSTHSQDDTAAAAQALMDLGVSNVVLTLGSRGSYLANKAYKEHIPAYRVDAVDTTGAGDVFSGFFAACLAKNIMFKDAARIASAAAALSVTRHGARSNLPQWQEVQDFIGTA